MYYKYSQLSSTPHLFISIIAFLISFHNQDKEQNIIRKKNQTTKKITLIKVMNNGVPGWIRTNDPLINSQML